jgi:major intracellular serine protease
MAYYIRTLTNSGVAVVVAAGNEGDGKPDTQEIFSYPAYIYEVITTGAVNQNGKAADYSNSFDGIDLAAPGTDIYSAWPGGGYKLLSGTSMAAPHVSGAYALLAALFRKREGRWPSTDEGEKILFRHIRQVPLDPLLVGRGMLDLNWETSRWPLYRVELGAFYRREEAKEMARKARENGFNVNITKY